MEFFLQMIPYTSHTFVMLLQCAQGMGIVLQMVHVSVMQDGVALIVQMVL
jgi:hypothetical protein